MAQTACSCSDGRGTWGATSEATSLLSGAAGPRGVRRRRIRWKSEGWPKFAAAIGCARAVLGLFAFCSIFLVMLTDCVNSGGLKLATLSPQLHPRAPTQRLATGHHKTQGAFPLSAAIGLPVLHVRESAVEPRAPNFASKDAESQSKRPGETRLSQPEGQHEASFDSREGRKVGNLERKQLNGNPVERAKSPDASSNSQNVLVRGTSEADSASVQPHAHADVGKIDGKREVKKPRKATPLPQVSLEPPLDGGAASASVAKEESARNPAGAPTSPRGLPEGENRQKNSFSLLVALLVALMGVMVVLLSVPWLLQLARYGVGPKRGRALDSARKRAKLSDVDERDPTIANLADVEDGFEKAS